jgi:hypothetical protein
MFEHLVLLGIKKAVLPGKNGLRKGSPSSVNNENVEEEAGRRSGIFLGKRSWLGAYSAF